WSGCRSRRPVSAFTTGLSRTLSRPSRTYDLDRMLFGSTDQDQMSSAGDSRAASLQFVSLVFTQPTPYPVALAGVHRPGQAGRGHRAAVADQLGSGELAPGGPGGSDGKE